MPDNAQKTGISEYAVEVRVFLVEDLHNMRDLMEDVCAAVGGLRIVASAAGEGEAKLWLDDNAGGWDLAIVDLILEQGSGIGVVAHAAQQARRGHIAVFSSYSSPAIVTHCERLGADAVFNKSDTGAFIAWLHQCVQQASSR